MIIGADQSTDADIIGTSERLYSGYNMRRVYYSAYSPIPDASGDLPPVSPPLIREHRLYQADWLFRFYGFKTSEILSASVDGMLDLDIDPKLSWALKHREWFPMDINRASKSQLMRVPGLGARTVEKLLSARQLTRLTLQDLAKLAPSVKKLMPFVETADWSPGGLTDSENLRARYAPPPEQLSLI
tara:strand:+ start:37 stop:594 length:558 start_codon:yes stop_codon:yes gene_type:complete